MKKKMITKLIAAVICGTMITGTGMIVPFAEEPAEMTETAAEIQELASVESQETNLEVQVQDMAAEAGQAEDASAAEDIMLAEAAGSGQVQESAVTETAAPEEAELQEEEILTEAASLVTVHFETAGLGEPIEDITVAPGSTIEKPEDPVSENFLFGGWFKENTLENEWNFEEDIVTEDTTLYAKWIISEEEKADTAEKAEGDAIQEEAAGSAVSTSAGISKETVKEEATEQSEEERAETPAENKEEAEEAAEDEEMILHAAAAEKVPDISYRTHVQTYGWQGYVKNGDMSGTQGQSKRLEGINIKISNLPVTGGVAYRTHVQTYGWQTWKENDQMAGTQGESKRLEAIQIKLTGEIAKKYDVYYQTHIQNFGWTGWASNGEMCGSAGYAYRLEGIRIKLVKKGNAAPGSSANRYYVTAGGEPVSKVSGASIGYNTHVQSYGWQNYSYDGAMAGTAGESKRLEGIHINLIDQPYKGGIEYRTHVQSIGWQGWRSNGAMAGTSGQSKRLEAIQIRLTGEMAGYYDVYYRVHAQTYGWLGWAKNGEVAGTAGLAKRLEAINIKLVKKGSAAPGSTSRTYVTDPSGAQATQQMNEEARRQAAAAEQAAKPSTPATPGNQSGNTTPNGSTQKECEHKNLVPVYKTVTRTEEETVVDKEGYWTQKCWDCGFIGNGEQQGAHGIIYQCMRMIYAKYHDTNSQYFDGAYEKFFMAHLEDIWAYARENEANDEKLTKKAIEDHFSYLDWAGEWEECTTNSNGHSSGTWYVDPETHTVVKTYQDKVVDYYKCADCGKRVKDGNGEVIETKLISTTNKA